MLRTLLTSASFVLVLVLATACGPRYVDFFPNHDDGSYKPHVALTPIVNATSRELPPDAAAQITNDIRYELMNNGNLYLPYQDEVQERLKNMDPNQYFNSDEAFAQRFCNEDFIVVMEMADYGISPYQSIMNTPYTLPCYPYQSVLTLKMRLKVLDLRPRCPRIILQEIVTTSAVIPNKAREGTSEESSRALAALRQAHHGMACRLASRIEEVIRSAY